MKKNNSYILIIFLLFTGITFASCGGSGRRAATYAGTKLVKEAEKYLDDEDDEEEYYDDEEDDDEGSSNISFKGKKIIVEPEYGGCVDDDCDCEQYAHYPGQSKCVNCAASGCNINKFGHTKR